MKILFKRLFPEAIVPTRAHDTDAGFDLTAIDVTHSDYHETGHIITCRTGISVAIPSGYVGLIFPRSSVFKYWLSQCNCVGVIDSGYRGELIVKFYDLEAANNYYKVGDRVAQLVVVPIVVDAEEVLELPGSDRGTNGFGSTGA